MKRGRQFHNALASQYLDTSSSSADRSATPELSDDEDREEELDARSTSSDENVAPPAPKRSKGFADLDSERALIDERLQTLKQRGHAQAEEFVTALEEENRTAIAKVVAYIPPLEEDPNYQKKMMAAFSFTVTFTRIVVPGQYEFGALFSYPPVLEAMRLMTKLFMFKPVDGISLSDSKKQFAAFLMPKEGNPKYKKPVMQGLHKFDCIDETVVKFRPEVCPSSKKNLHMQCHLNVFYRYDGHFFHMDVDEIRNNFRENGYDNVYLHVEAVETAVYASEMYMEIPAKKKSQAYWEKVNAGLAIAESRSIQGPKGTFSVSKYIK